MRLRGLNVLHSRRIITIGVEIALIGLYWGAALFGMIFIPPIESLFMLVVLIFVTQTHRRSRTWLRNYIFLIVSSQREQMRHYRQNLDHTKAHRSQPGLLTGHNIGGYQMLNLIGSGGFSEVYTSQSGGLLLAVKVVDVGKSPEHRMRFEREVAALSIAKHPNVVQMFDSGFDGQYAYIVMEYIEGQSLRSHIQEHAPLKLNDVLDILQGLADATDQMHKLGIVHRDLKPGNIMVHRDNIGRWTPMLIDFGVAKQSYVTVITLEGTVGTVEYMSPEQITEAPMVGAASDVYAMGIMTYEMLTGQLPYNGGIGTILFGHLHDPVPNPCERLPGLPLYIGAAVQKAMAKQPHERYQSLSEFVRALRNLNEATTERLG